MRSAIPALTATRRLVTSRLARLVGRSGPEWALLSLWVAILGVQLPVDIPNFRFSPADVVLAALMGTLAIRRPRQLLATARRITPLHVLIGVLFIALAWSSIVSIVRTGTLVREAALNKDGGFFVLASIALAVLTVVRDRDDVRVLLRNLLVSGTVVAWVGAITTLLVPLALGLPFGQRLNGLLLNPSANAVFLSVLLMVQIGSALGPRIVSWPYRLQVINTLGLTLLLLLTLSRSTWLAVIFALVGLIVLIARDRPILPAAIAFMLVLVTAQPLAAALLPVVNQVTTGQLGRFEREVAPRSTPPIDLTKLVSSAPAVAAPSATPPMTVPPSAAPSFTTRPLTTVSPVPAAVSPIQSTLPPAPSTGAAAVPTTPTPEPAADRYLRDARLTAADRYGGTDRLAFDLVALKLWLGSPGTALTGIGLDVFLQISPVLFGTSAIIHSTYVWLPVEMGLPGIVLLVAFVYLLVWMGLALRRGVIDRAIATSILGSLMVFGVWLAENEGLYQRSLWLMLALGVASAAGSTRRGPDGV